MSLPRLDLVRPVPAPRQVRAGLEAVQLSDRTNILDRPAVADLAADLGFPEAARWARENGPPTRAGSSGASRPWPTPKETAP
jgi:hypothetical protein